MKILLSAAFVLFASVCAWSQGAAFPFAGITNPQGQPVPGVQLHFCNAGAVVTSGVCAPTVTVYKDSALTIPWGSAILTDGLGNFPEIWFTPNANYCYSVSGFPAATNTCYPFSVSVVPGSSPSFTNVSVNGSLFLFGQSFATGTCAAPPYSFQTQTNAGLCLDSVGTVGLSAGGVAQLRATSTGVTAGNINNRYYVDGTKYAKTQAGVQSAFTDACTAFPSGTTVYLPPGSITLSSNANQLLLITCPLHVVGASGWGTGFVADNGILNTIPWIRVKYLTTANNEMFSFENIYFKSADNTNATGGDGILFDNTNDAGGGPSFINIGPQINFFPNSVGGRSINYLNTNSPVGQLVWQIHDSGFWNGIKFAGADELSIRNNAIAGTTNPCIELSPVAGGANQSIENNWTGAGCTAGTIIIHQGSQIKIRNNQFEQIAASTEANSAMIDLQCDVAQCSDIQIIGNNINSSSNVTNNIRIGNAVNTTIEGNVFSVKAVSGVGILLTVSASNTRFPFNNFGSLAGGAVAYSNAGSTTVLAIKGPGGSSTNPSITSLDAPTTGFSFASSLPDNIFVSASGSNSYLFSASEFRGGSGTEISWSSNAQAVVAVADTGASRCAAGVICAGNGTPGNASGELRSAKISATYNAAGTVQTAVHIVQDTCTLGTNCAVTLAGSAVFTNATSYTCIAQDTTAAAATKVVQTNGSTVTFTGTGVDVLRYICIGN